MKNSKHLNHLGIEDRLKLLSMDIEDVLREEFEQYEDDKRSDTSTSYQKEENLRYESTWKNIIGDTPQKHPNKYKRLNYLFEYH